jgi:hypothetical protein
MYNRATPGCKIIVPDKASILDLYPEAPEPLAGPANQAAKAPAPF